MVLATEWLAITAGCKHGRLLRGVNQLWQEPGKQYKHQGFNINQIYVYYLSSSVTSSDSRPALHLPPAQKSITVPADCGEGFFMVVISQHIVLCLRHQHFKILLLSSCTNATLSLSLSFSLTGQKGGGKKFTRGWFDLEAEPSTGTGILRHGDCHYFSPRTRYSAQHHPGEGRDTHVDETLDNLEVTGDMPFFSSLLRLLRRAKDSYYRPLFDYFPLRKILQTQHSRR
ncbi:hypothetical protein F4810DRAFT_269901 [Camillea tinctor]|nr:hypothetical protein F4810DRAFT_269901 [Camillea tinctor]